MKNKFLIIAIVLALLGIGGYVYFKGNKLSGTQSQITSGVKSLKDLIAAGVPQKCTFSSGNDSDKTEGTSYIAGGKVRADITNTSSGKATVSHMITDNKTSYIWSDQQKDGFKMTVTETEGQPTPGTEVVQGQGSQGADLNKTENYECSGWIPDDSLFNPPANVTFTDFSQMFKTPVPGTGAPSTGTSSQCSYCDTLSGGDQTSCKAALGCK